METHKLYIGGEWIDSDSGQTLDVVNPATEEVIAKVAAATPEDVNTAVMAARDAFESGVWSELGAGERAAVLYKLADKLEDATGELAEIESRNAGKPMKLARDSDI